MRPLVALIALDTQAVSASGADETSVVRACPRADSYAPNFEGQESTETEDGTPVYRYAHIEDVILSMLGEAHLKKYETSNDEVRNWRPKEEARAGKR